MKKDNGSGVAKQRVRLDVVRNIGPDAMILEGFCGEGSMFDSCWSAFGGATMDMNERKVHHAAMKRPHWACYVGNTQHALRDGWMSHVPFEVVDLDAYGSPWPFVRAWALSSRARAAKTTVILTDGYMRQANLSPACSALFPGKKGRMDVSPPMYREAIDSRLREWSERWGRMDLVRSVKDRNMVLHVVEAVTR